MSTKSEHRPSVAPRAGHWLIALAVIAHAVTLVAQQPEEPAWMPFAEGENRPSIDIAINGRKTIALIDTSISTNAISHEFAREADIEPGTRSVSLPDIRDGEELPLSSTFTLEFGGNPIELDNAVMIPAEGFGLIVGRPLLDALVVQIDYPNQRLRFISPDMASFKGNVKLKRGRFNQPMVEARLNGKRTWMNLDTSSDTLCLLTERIVGKHDWRGPEIAADKLNIAGVAVRPDVEIMRLDQLELGPFTIENVLAAAPVGGGTEPAGYGAQRIHKDFGGHGILGHEIMRHFVVTIALGDDNVHFYAQ